MDKKKLFKKIDGGKASLKDYILKGQNPIEIGDIQFTVENLVKKKDTPNRHLYRDCPSLLRWNPKLKVIDKGEAQNYPLCPICRKRFASTTV